jgi:hypothetical protein
MIINVRGCSNKPGIIVSYLVENEENTGYDSFNAKKIMVKNKIDILAAIKKTLISSRKLTEISADDFVSTINGVGKKNTFDTSLKTIVKSINDENMRSTMSTLSHVYFNNKPLSQVKAINIINGNMYFMVKMGSNYNLEPIKSEKIKCVIVISSLVNLYRRVKQGGLPPKNSFKKHYIQSRSIPSGIGRDTSGTIRGTYQNNAYNSFGEAVVDSNNICHPTEPVPEERPTNPPRTAVREITLPTISPPISPPDNDWCSPTLYSYSAETTNRQVPEDLANIDIPTIERPLRLEEIERLTNVETTMETEVIETNEEERPVVITLAEREPEEERQIDAEEERRDNLERLSDEIEEEEEDRPVVIDLATDLETQDIHCESRRETEMSNINRYDESQREAEIAVSVSEVMAANELPETDREERRDNLNEVTVPVSDVLTERFTRARVATEAESAPIPPLLAERPRQIVERNRRSFVEYLRENQTNTFNIVRGNDSSSS